jgi:hypothetical protein
MIGIVAVAFLAAKPATNWLATMTVTRSATNLSATDCKRLGWPSDERNSIATFWLSTEPASLSALRNIAQGSSRHRQRDAGRI